VFAKVKNGQKKCPILKNPGTLPKYEFPKIDLDHNALNAKILIQKVLRQNFNTFLRKGFRHFFY
jgi:hypothetical protein